MASHKESKQNNPKDFLTWFEKLREFMSDLPVKDTSRNNKLRNDIMRRVVSQCLTDDERAEFLGLPKGCRIREGAKIITQENLRIGEYCWIGENAILDASGGLEIGSHCSIGLSVFIWSHSSHLTNLTMNNESGSDLIYRKGTKIGNGCFIAGPSVILPGVTIGDQVLIKPFTTVAKDIPDRSIVNGNDIKNGVLTDALIRRQIAKVKKSHQEK